MLEVEAKFIVDSFEGLENKYKFCDPVLQRDTYYQHPGKDFLKTNEWFRIRDDGKQHLICYKAPGEKTASGVKSRKEIELAVEAGMTELLQILGFEKLVVVEKYRRSFVDKEFATTLTLDEVVGLGKYVEIEVLVEDEEQKSHAIVIIERLAKELGLTRPEKRGYAKMMLMPDPRSTQPLLVRRFDAAEVPHNCGCQKVTCD